MGKRDVKKMNLCVYMYLLSTINIIIMYRKYVLIKIRINLKINEI